MSHTVAAGEFEGPLGVLLELVERNKLEVSAISVGQITGDYLSYIRNIANVSAEELSEFIQLGARLLFIKSLALLPQEGTGQQATELARLENELSEYRKFQQAAVTLSNLSSSGTWTHPVTPQDLTATPFPNLKIEDLSQAFSRILTRLPAPSPQMKVKQHLSMETIKNNLRKMLPDKFELEDIVNKCRSRIEVIVTFLAVLELIRDGTATVIQKGQFETILVGPANV